MINPILEPFKIWMHRICVKKILDPGCKTYSENCFNVCMCYTLLSVIHINKG